MAICAKDSMGCDMYRVWYGRRSRTGKDKVWYGWVGATRKCWGRVPWVPKIGYVGKGQ